MSRQRKRRRPVSEINVVPYIDVMLVLLVIFMITAPLLTQGVKVDLPNADAEALPPDAEEPLVITVNAAGEFFIDTGEDAEQPVSPARLQQRVGAIRAQKPRTPVMVKGDRDAGYGRVVEAMVLLQQVGVADVGLITDPPEG